jgi:hypothetical protein
MRPLHKPAAVASARALVTLLPIGALEKNLQKGKKKPDVDQTSKALCEASVSSENHVPDTQI